ncbi:MAG: GtrA family protein [Candidatus Dormibacteria bacterium]
MSLTQIPVSRRSPDQGFRAGGLARAEVEIHLGGTPWVLAEIAELRHPRRSPLLRFFVIGAISTAAYVGIFLALSSVMVETLANITASVLTTLMSTALNCVYTFGEVRFVNRLRAQAGGLVALAISVLVTSAALWVLADLDDQPSALALAATLVPATAIAGLLRFALLRRAIRPARQAV